MAFYLSPRCILPLFKNTLNTLFLHTAMPDRYNRYSYLYTQPIRILSTNQPHKVLSLLAEADRAQLTHWVAGYTMYEAAAGLGLPTATSVRNTKKTPLIWLGIYNEPYIYDHQTGRWNHVPKGISDPIFHTKNASHSKESPIINNSTITGRTYSAAVRNIKKHIATGQTYQVNFTFDMNVSTNLEPEELYAQLIEQQPTAWSAYLQTDDITALSFSPELFFKTSGSHITVQPMKGTALPGSASGNAQLHNAKNRAENLMIVDLMRHDLGKVCVPRSIKVPHLFSIEQHPTIAQMTSRVTGTLRHGTRFSHLVQALFPSGSVSGAPKHQTMSIIKKLEQGKRGIYCGMIGFSAPGGKQMCWNVPIRTLQKEVSQKQWRYRVGSGIVWDSRAAQEYQECIGKGRFITAPPPMMIFESMRYEHSKLHHRAAHTQRFKNAAHALGYPWNNQQYQRTLSEIYVTIHACGCYKVRIVLPPSGAFYWEHERIAPHYHGTRRAKIMTRQMRRDQRHLVQYKTTFRPWYAAGTALIRRGQCFEVIYINKDGSVAEGSRSNVFIKKNNTLYTPPRSSGILPGTLRAQLIKQGKCTERIITVKDLKTADAVYCGNDVRGLVKVVVERTR